MQTLGYGGSHREAAVLLLSATTADGFVNTQAISFVDLTEKQWQIAKYSLHEKATWAALH